MTDLTRMRKFNEKKTVSLSAARILHTDVAGVTLQELFNLPKEAMIISAGVLVKTAGQGGLTVDFGFAGGDELGNNLALDSTGYKATPIVTALTSGALTGTVTTLTGTVTALTLNEAAPPTLASGTVALTSGALTGTVSALAGTAVMSPRIYTETGKNVTATFSADPTAGDFVFMVEYYEFDLGNGTLTNYTA